MKHGFKPGQSGNPAGRPKGTKDRRTELRELLAPHAQALVQQCVDMARAGDVTALRICMDRLVAPIREERIEACVPPITNAHDCVAAQASVIEALTTGAMLPSQAQVVSGLIEAQRRAYESSDLAKRIVVLEDQLNAQLHRGVTR